MLVIWSRLDTVDEGERLRIEARLESLTRHAPVARVQIEGIPPDEGAVRETVRITGKVEGMAVVAIREEASLSQALEGALRAFEESILRMSERWASREADAKKPLAAAGRPMILELGEDRPSWGERLAGLLPRLPARSMRFRRISGAISISALLVALAAERCNKPEVSGFSAVATEAPSRSFSAESERGAERQRGSRGLPPVSRRAPAAPSSESRPAPRSFGARAQTPPDEMDERPTRRSRADSRPAPRFSANSDADTGTVDEQPPDPGDEPERPGVLRRRP